MKIILNKFFVCLLLGVISMLNLFGCFSNLKYEKYSSKDPELNITMDYISGWLFSEHRGSYGSYAQVIFYEPESKDKTLKAGIVVTANKIEPAFPTIKEFSDDLITKRLKFKDAAVLLKSKIELIGTEAINIELSYKTLDKLYGKDAKLVPVKEKIVVFKRNDKFYVVRYENTEEEFTKFYNAFNRIIKTLRFK